ncbi:aldehyde dehydrogenase family protein [Actinomadura spongiicola]|uniref:Aldehyde dehydrogenase family protein n=2 Tax=Actinomadura spongiicola TaxID=2303421 RepID=A0A372GQL1_9ACTN|nr:aldehyde dehydrogenase family protein [Actinomadura spongiicola]
MPASTAEWEAIWAVNGLPEAMWLDGAWSPAADGSVRTLVTPRDGSDLATVPAGGVADVERAVAGARRAFDSGVWSRLPPRERGDVLLRWADLLERHRDELALLIALEMGKPVVTARTVEVRTSIGLVRWYGELADKLMDESPRGRPDSLAIVSREPLGVVGAITPWNFPLTLACFKVPAALVAGNSVVLKPASQTPLSMLRVAELGSRAGLPDGVLQVITGSGPVIGEALARHPGVDTLTFTGSPAVGGRLLRSAGESNLKPVALELGGKSPNIIFDDVEDLDAAMDSAAWAIAFNSGQMCTAGSRLLVHASLHDEVVAGVTERLATLRAGDPLDPATDFGPLATRGHREDVAAEIRAGRRSGARLVLGGEEIPDGPGFHLSPAVFTEVSPGDRLAQHEIFGPVLSVLRFRDEDEAVKIANDSDFGLGASVWTGGLRRAHRVSRRIVAGTVWVNCYEEGDASVPFGGRKLSGHGADKSVHGLDKFTALKTTWMAL